MSAAAKSVYIFGFYLYLTGITLIFIPNIFLSTLQLPQTDEVWIRVVGVLAFCLGYYYHRTGVKNNFVFFPLTVTARLLVFVSFTVFVLLKFISPVLLIFAIIDLAGALWTWLALKNELIASPQSNGLINFSLRFF
ncbi:MAG TPA: hypothetical protein VFN30_11290 [Chitinophagaceae bacterium]|nr:hypothetical protein [Chitinophagaceae bacterium]